MSGTEAGFLLKAISETGGELQRLVGGAAYVDPHQVPEGEDASLVQVVVHLRDCEEYFLDRLERMARYRAPEIPAFDTGDLPDPERCRWEDAERTAGEFAYLRRNCTYLLWELDDRQWRRDGVHPYRGRMTIADAVREMHEHDLEHLWQLSRIIGKLLEERSTS